MRLRKNVTLAALALALAIGASVRWDAEVGALLLLSAGMVWALVPGLAMGLRRRGLMVEPGGRGSHLRSTPAYGGFALFVPVAAYLAWQGLVTDARLLGLLGASAVLLALGALDDARPVRPLTKLSLQTVAALTLWMAGYRVHAMELEPLGTLAPLDWSALLLVLWVLLVTNAWNLVDGTDGLASALGLIAAVALALAGAHVGLAAVVAGACLGFLRHNLPRARIFLGDSGSLLVGVWIAALCLHLPRSNNVALVLGAVAYPLGDVVFTTLRRLVRGKPLFMADRSHVHHKVLDWLRSPSRALAVLCAFAVLLAAIPFATSGVTALALGSLAWLAAVAWLWLHGGVDLARLWRERPRFRRLHAAHARIAQRLRQSRTRDEVSAALGELSSELGVVGLELGDLRLGAPLEAGSVAGPPGQSTHAMHAGRAVFHGERARWRLAPGDPLEVALNCEREVILRSALGQAAARWVRVNAVKGG